MEATVSEAATGADQSLEDGETKPKVHRSWLQGSPRPSLGSRGQKKRTGRGSIPGATCCEHGVPVLTGPNAVPLGGCRVLLGLLVL